jgi:Ca2+-binding RTX toxin-like protein
VVDVVACKPVAALPIRLVSFWCRTDPRVLRKARPTARLGSGGSGGGGSGHGPDGTVLETGVRSGDGFATVSYTPTIDTLIDRVGDLNPPPRLRNSLLRKLNAAKQNPDAACRQLAGFIVQVRRQSGDQIRTPDADLLIAEADEVRDSLNCGAPVGTCAGKVATIVGTGHADKLRGTKGDDVIAAGGGDDRVVGLGGDDLVCGGSGADVIRAGGGDDTLRGGRGPDRCRGGGGSDRQRHC